MRIRRPYRRIELLALLALVAALGWGTAHRESPRHRYRPASYARYLSGEDPWQPDREVFLWLVREARAVYPNDVTEAKLEAGIRGELTNFLEQAHVDAGAVGGLPAGLLEMPRAAAAQYRGQVAESLLWLACCQGVIGALDEDEANAHVLSPKQYGALNCGDGPAPCGIGVQVEWCPEGARLVDVYAGLPAARSDLQEEDIILSIDRQPAGLTIEDIRRRLRGPQGSQVQLTCQRGSQRFDLRLTREPLKLEALSLRLPDQVAYVRPYVLSDETAPQVGQALARLRPTGVILDMRKNLGGYLYGGLELCSLFAPRGSLYVEGDYRTKQKRYVTRRQPVCVGPIVVLMDRDTTGASEVVCACLRDTVGARLVGEPTAGEANVSQLLPMQDRSGDIWALVLPCAFYYSASGQCLHRQALDPDVTLLAPREGHPDRDALVQRAEEMLRHH